MTVATPPPPLLCGPFEMVTATRGLLAGRGAPRRPHQP
jgi:hypothetical protein